MSKKINFLFVTLFGIGKIKKIPGSIASLFTILFLFFLFHIINIDPNIVLISLIIIFFISLYTVNNYIKNLDDKDPKEIVIDEFIGQSIPICLYEIAHETTKETNEILTFYFICLYCSEFSISLNLILLAITIKFKNSFGVIMDDVLAGLYVVAVLVLYMVLGT